MDSLGWLLGLVNTRQTERFDDELTSLDELSELADRHGLSQSAQLPLPQEPALEAVRFQRDQVAAAFETRTADRFVEVVDLLASRYAVRPTLVEDSPADWHVTMCSEEPRPWIGASGAELVNGLVELVVVHGVDRVGICADGACETYFVDLTRNHSRRYCSHRCAVRSGVAAHRSRQRAR